MRPDEIEALLAVDGGDDYTPPDKTPGKVYDDGWRPALNPTQQLIFDDPSRFVLAEGCKGSGKTLSFAHKIVRHCYENENAFYIVITPTVFTGSEGIWQDLETLVLPAWRDGNKHSRFLEDGETPNPHYGELMDNGMGLEYTESRLDPQTKDKIIWIGNRFGGWSKIVLKSIPYAVQVEARIKGPAPSGIYVDELTNTEGRQYFTFPAAQLGRRRSIEGPQQFCASYNPAGPSNWVFKEFYIPPEGVDENELHLIRSYDQGGIGRGAYDEDYAIYNVHISENLKHIGADYVRNLKKVFSKDPVESQRLIDGLWIDRPTGDSIFSEHFIESIHVKGDAGKGEGLMPVVGHPIIVSYDPGPANFSVHFLQCIPIKKGSDEKLLWLVFDELNYVGKRQKYSIVVPNIMLRMAYWQKRMSHNFVFEHISDEAAFTHQDKEGSYDAADVERLSREFLDKHSFPNLKPIKMKACPKGKDTVPARVRLLMTLLSEECLLVSALCPKTKEMFQHLERENETPGKYDPLAAFRPRRSPHLHPFDSLSYAPFYYSFGTARFFAQTGSVVKPQVYMAGGR